MRIWIPRLAAVLMVGAVLLVASGIGALILSIFWRPEVVLPLGIGLVGAGFLLSGKAMECIHRANGGR